MEIRDAVSEDVEAIREVARESMRESYGHAVDGEVLERAIDRWYDPADIGDDVTSSSTVFAVAVEDTDVVGFAESYVVKLREPVGQIDWLHVHPEHRGKGIGSQLLAYVEQALRDADVERIEGRVLEANQRGTEFYETEGYEESGSRPVDIGRETFTERQYTKSISGDPELEVETRVTADGEEVSVAFDEAERGSIGPFYPAYADPKHADRYGYMCGNCESLEISIDTMDRIECADCGNRQKPTRWDAAYL